MLMFMLYVCLVLWTKMLENFELLLFVSAYLLFVATR